MEAFGRRKRPQGRVMEATVEISPIATRRIEDDGTRRYRLEFKLGVTSSISGLLYVN
jgi:hypothetical protein